MESTYLAHYGVKGMKWGVRKDPEKAYARRAKKLNRKALRQQAKIKQWQYDRDKSASAANYWQAKREMKDTHYRQFKQKQSQRHADKRAAWIEKGAAKTNAILDQAENEGYEVYAKKHEFTITTGAAYVNGMAYVSYKRLIAPSAQIRVRQ